VTRKARPIALDAEHPFVFTSCPPPVAVYAVGPGEGRGRMRVRKKWPEYGRYRLIASFLGHLRRSSGTPRACGPRLRPLIHCKRSGTVRRLVPFLQPERDVLLCRTPAWCALTHAVFAFLVASIDERPLR
jgi:hypothetical protein